jgi:quercetin dioxygenase-like cupin family protein
LFCSVDRRQELKGSDVTSAPALKPFRRIVTAHDEGGSAIVASIDPLTPTMIPSGDAAFQLVWTTPAVPVDLNAGTDGASSDDSLIGRGSVLRVVDMLPGKSSPMHRTVSIDYGIVISGQLELTLDGGETVALAAGDIVVQRGTNHLWRNPSATDVTRVAFVLIEAKPVVVNGQPLGEIHP